MRGLFANPRNVLIVIHDLIATAAAILAAFYFRFEAVGLADRLDWLMVILPGYLVAKDGNVELPVLGTFKLAGLTTEVARDTIQQRARAILVLPRPRRCRYLPATSPGRRRRKRSCTAPAPEASLATSVPSQGANFAP